MHGKSILRMLLRVMIIESQRFSGTGKKCLVVEPFVLRHNLAKDKLHRFLRSKEISTLVGAAVEFGEKECAPRRLGVLIPKCFGGLEGFSIVPRRDHPGRFLLTKQKIGKGPDVSHYFILALREKLTPFQKPVVSPCIMKHCIGFSLIDASPCMVCNPMPPRAVVIKDRRGNSLTLRGEKGQIQVPFGEPSQGSVIRFLCVEVHSVRSSERIEPYVEPIILVGRLVELVAPCKPHLR